MSNRTALFIIDIQNDFKSIPHFARIHSSASAVLASTRKQLDIKRDDPSRPLIVIVQHEEPPTEKELIRGTEGWELVFPPREGDADEVLVGKTTLDTFESNPNLATNLREKGITSVVTLGIQSENCVRGTSLGALAAGFPVTVLKGAHSTFDVGDKPAVQVERDIEAELEKAGAKIVPWESVIV